MAPLPASVRLDTGLGGLPRVRVDAPGGSAEVYLQGAHVTTWQPAGEDPVLWVSARSRFEAGVAIRGGVPICFPWFGPHPSDAAAPAHGFARLSQWELTGAHEDAVTGDVTVELRLGDSPATRASAWPHAFAAVYRVTVGTSLHLELAVTNRDTRDLDVSEALHTYLAVGDVRTVALDGLAGARYVDKVAAGGPEHARQGPEPVRVTAETDRVYAGTGATVTVVDPAGGRSVVVAKDGSRSTVVWNPWVSRARAMADVGDDEWPTMVCVEAANVLDDALVLAPGETHRLSTTLTVTHASTGDGRAAGM